MALFHTATGAEDAPALLLIHPLGGDHRFWDECLPTWTARYRCIACDLRPIGLSLGTGVPISLDEHVRDLEALREALGISALAIVGCALGGMVGAHYAATHPSRARALIMANPGLRQGPDVAEAFSERARIVRERGLDALLPAAADRIFAGLAHDRRFERFVSHFRAQDPEAYAQALLGFLDTDVTADIGRIQCPLLLVPGLRDEIMPRDAATEILALAPHARLAPIEPASHFVPLQAPDRFAAQVVDFLRDVRP